MTGRPTPSLMLLAAVTAIGFAALHIVVPVLPVLATAFDTGAAPVQLVLTLYFAGIAAGQLVYGPVSDRFGRRPVLIAGLVMFLAGTLLCGLAWSLVALICGRVIEAVGACAGIVLGRAIIRDVYEREMAARGIALVMMAMTLAPAVSPAIGAYLAQWIGWRSIFGFLAGLGAIVLVLTVRRLGETNTAPARLDVAGMLLSYGALLRSPAFLGFALCSACTSASWFTFCASAPFVLSQLMHRPPSTYGLMILLPMAAYMLGNAVAARLAMRVGSMPLFVIGLAVSFVSGIVMALWCLVAPSPWALFAPIALSSIGNGMSQPPAMAAGLSVHPRSAGAASGLIGCLQMAVSSLGSFLVGVLPHDSTLPMVSLVGAFMALAMVFGIPAVRLPPARRGATGGIVAAGSGAIDY
ncbi:MAG TPA: multidrug effflux MFS transporter [Stellaceae bacterium]|nr:multidrug effflux MFS transporter [Stellaceae bacterium]